MQPHPRSAARFTKSTGGSPKTLSGSIPRRSIGAASATLRLKLDDLSEREQPGADHVGPHERLDQRVGHRLRIPRTERDDVDASGQLRWEIVLELVEDLLEVVEAPVPQAEVRRAVRLGAGLFVVLRERLAELVVLAHA